ISADRIVTAGHERQLELRADAVGARHEHRFVEARGIKLEERAERSEIRQHARRKRRASERSDASNGFVARVDVYAGCLVVHRSTRLQKSSLPMRVCISARRADASGASQ